MKKIIIFSLCIFSSHSFSKTTDGHINSFKKCISDSSENPMSTDCINTELLKQQNIINNILSKNNAITSPKNGEVIDLKSWTDSQNQAINNKCSLWLKSGGQNGVLLEKQCVLDETISIKILLNNFIDSING